MFGYVTPIKEQLSVPDFVLFRAFYCGICKNTGRLFGQLPRFTTNYDITFLSVLLHDFAGQVPQFENSACVLNPVKKKTTVCRNELLDKIAYTNVILSYYKLTDAVVDKEGAGKRTVRRLLSPAYKKAAEQCPEIDKAVSSSYSKLFEAEKQNVAGIDRVSDHFASMLKNVAAILLEDRADENILKLCYNVGKFVYLADALDDIDEDFKKKRYNPFLAVFPDFTSRQQYFKEHNEELSFALTSTVNRAIECSNKICFTQSDDLVYNIVHKGLRAKVAQLFASEKKLKKPRL